MPIIRFGVPPWVEEMDRESRKGHCMFPIVQFFLKEEVPLAGCSDAHVATEF